MEVHPLSSKGESWCQLSADHIITTSSATERHRGELYQDAKPIVPWRKKKTAGDCGSPQLRFKKMWVNASKVDLGPQQKAILAPWQANHRAWEMRIFTLRKTSQNPQLASGHVPISP